MPKTTKTKIIEVKNYLLYSITGTEYITRINDIMTTVRRGNKMHEVLRVSNNKGKYRLEGNEGTIERVNFREPRDIYWDLSLKLPLNPYEHLDEHVLTLAYQGFVAFGKPTKIRIVTIKEVIETLDQRLQQTEVNT